MPQFRKKASVISAVRHDVTRDDQEQNQSMLDVLEGCDWHMTTDGICIRTANGGVTARHGDWVCRQVVNGKVDVWPCADDIFEATYEAAD